MTSASPDLEVDNALWRFVLPFYGRDGVSAACLTLQETLGVDVNVLLFAIFAQVARGIVLDTSDLRVVDALVRDWRGEVVQPLRKLRTRMKAGPAPAPSAATDRLRSRIKAVELDAEQIELALLLAWLERQPPRPAHAADAEDVPLTVARYFHARPDEALPGQATEALATLRRAMRDAAKNP